MRREAIPWGMVLALLACGTPDGQPDAGAEGAEGAVEAGTPATVPSSLAEIAPGDTGAILGLMRRVMTAGDSVALLAERRDTVLPAGGEREPRRLTLYTRGGELLKLVATEPNDAGQMVGETAAWFVGGEVRVVLEPFAGYFLDGDRLVLWSDATLVPIGVPEADRMARERAVLDTLQARLGAFGVRYPS